jgi:NAD(P)-dependent dehydrogenase (short-subunit alcohol dehydrogenase family)
MYQNIAVIGGSGAIGSAFISLLSEYYPTATLHVFSRVATTELTKNVHSYSIDYADEQSIIDAARLASHLGPIDMVFIATGLLHDDAISPEKSLKDISAEKLTTLFMANTVLPALIGKHFLPHLNKRQRSVFATLSARVGSISDNHLGGWYAYRASKAALNMIIKTAAIEVSRTNPHAIVVGLHPGTVDSQLSKPFQSNLAKGSLFSAKESAQHLFTVINSLTPSQSGRCFAWDGNEIKP